MSTIWKEQFAQRVQGMVSSAAREILKITQQPDVISFAGGLPAPEAFPIDAIQAAACRVLESRGVQALQYSTTEGFLPLRKFIVEKMSRYGIVANEDNVLITTGSQQALDLIGKIFLDPDDVVLCEAPTYLGALQAFRAYQARFATVPIDDDGMRVDEIEPILRLHKNKIIYALPNFQNPAGTTISLARRQKLVALADAHGIPLVEDDPYGELRFEGDHLTPLVVLDGQLAIKRGATDDALDRGNVIYMSTFSKTLAPGLRLGWVVAPRQVIEKLVQAKQGTDLHTSTFDQMLAYEIVKEEGFLVNHVRMIRTLYIERRDEMLKAMQKYFPANVHWTTPKGGLFLWVTLPHGIDTKKLIGQAVAEQVAFVPGGAFYPAREALYRKNGDEWQLPLGHNTMRLNFSNASPSKIEEGIKRLARVIDRAMDKPEKAAA